MQMRGVAKQNSTTITSAFSGEFLTNDTTRQEFVSLLQLKK
jgi:GTP cyclohydrolase I